MTGVDTGFFFALEDRNPMAVSLWKEKRDLVTSSVVIYELQKHLLKGEFAENRKLVADIRRALPVLTVTDEVALRAARLAHGTALPGLDALILASLLEAGCKEIYTTDSHLLAYKKKSVKIINLRISS